MGSVIFRFILPFFMNLFGIWFGYGLGRVWMEGLRTDQLFLWGTPIAVSQALSALLVVGAGGCILYKRLSMQRKTAKKK